MKEQATVTKIESEAIRKILDNNTAIIRWPRKDGRGNSTYTELAKQGANEMATYIIANIAENTGWKINYNVFPYVMLKQLIRKSVTGDFRENHLQEIYDFYGVEKNEIENLVNKIFNDKFPEFAKKLKELEKDATYENCVRIFTAARRIMTWIEFNEHGIKSAEVKEELEEALNDIKDVPGVTEILFVEDNPVRNLFEYISQLKFLVRWNKQYRGRKCTVLEHLAETGFLSWFMALEENSNDITTATHLFFCGIFHDLPEFFTGDMASPLKNSIKNLRKATEEYENYKMNKYIYTPLINGNYEYLVKAIKRVMIEEKENSSYHTFLKKADYLSAYFECYRHFLCGSRDVYFYNVVKENYIDRKKYPKAFRHSMERIFENMSNEKFYD